MDTAAAAMLAAAGYAVPRIPAGCNTVHAFVRLKEGPALAINQSGFTPLAADNEQEINGCSLLILFIFLRAACG